MPDASKEYEVLAYFHARDPKTGKTVFYHPDKHDEEAGTGWPGARQTFRGDPNSDQVKELLEGPENGNGPLIAEKKATSSSSSSSSSTSANKEN